MYAIELSFIIITLLAFVLGLYFKKASLQFVWKFLLLLIPLLAIFYFLVLVSNPKLWLVVPVIAIAAIMGLMTKKKNFRIMNFILFVIISLSVAYWIIPIIL